MASRFPVTFFKRKIQRKLPGRLPGVPSRFPVTFWLSKFWTWNLGCKTRVFVFYILTWNFELEVQNFTSAPWRAKRPQAGNGSIILHIYRFLPRCRYIFGRSANNAPKSMILWRFTTKRYQKSSTQAQSHHLSTSHWLCQWARPPQMVQVRKASQMPSVGKPPKWPSGRPSKKQ